ncbi:MAG: hypothetical protein AB2A00_42325, partial [Myxococcota bacterium]
MPRRPKSLPPLDPPPDATEDAKPSHLRLADEVTDVLPEPSTEEDAAPAVKPGARISTPPTRPRKAAA